MQNGTTFRFAPSPNGELHLGHALSALVGFRAAARVGGRFLLRIEDIDVARCREAYVAALFEDLAWLGLSWEEPVLRQSEHFAVYQSAAAVLCKMGLAYPCFATRSEIEGALNVSTSPLDPDGVPIYPGMHKNLSSHEVARRKADGEPFALRLDMQKAVAVAREKLGGAALCFREVDGGDGSREVVAQPELWGDVILVRKDVPASYHLAVCIDDARQGVTHVTRGMDLFAATDVHRLLQVLLDLPQPVYQHHALLRTADGRKLSKSARDVSLRSLRRDGLTAQDVVGLLQREGGL